MTPVSRGQQVRTAMPGKEIADIAPTGATGVDDRVRQLVIEGRVAPASLARPKRAPRLVKPSRSASSLVLSERNNPEPRRAAESRSSPKP